MIHWIYERAILRGIEILPARICFMITESDMEASPRKLNEVTKWCLVVNNHLAWKNYRQTMTGKTPVPAILGVTFHISTPVPQDMQQFLPAVRKIGTISRLVLHIGDKEEVAGSGMDVVVAIGNSGREEITACIRRMAEDHIPPEKVDEKMLESYLTFKYTPDVVIKTGGDHLTDFLIWQSVYSELFFSDVNWKYVRKVDFLRVLRDYQSRVRRFGK